MVEYVDSFSLRFVQLRIRAKLTLIREDSHISRIKLAKNRRELRRFNLAFLRFLRIMLKKIRNDSNMIQTPFLVRIGSKLIRIYSRSFKTDYYNAFFKPIWSKEIRKDSNPKIRNNFFRRIVRKRFAQIR